MPTTKTQTLELSREEAQLILSLIPRDKKTQRRVVGLMERLYDFLAKTQ